MGVSKQDWKDYQSNVWLGGDRKSTLDELMQAFDGVFKAIDGGDATEFLAYTEDNGKLKVAADRAENAASQAGEAIRALRLEGSQRRFANKNAIATNDDAIASVEQYHHAVYLLCQGLVRGVRIEHDKVAADQAEMPAIKSGDLTSRLEQERSRVLDCADFADTKVAALAAVEKIGVV